jgi:triosephosphate isomerase
MSYSFPITGVKKDTVICLVFKEIQSIIPDKPILCGGSINKDNAGDYLKIAGVGGLMVGTASLDPEEFALICETASRT